MSLNAPDDLPVSAARENLKRLAIIRIIAFVGQAGGVAFAYFYLAAALNYWALVAVLTAVLLITLLTLLRLRSHRPVTDGEYFVQLMSDVVALTMLLYLAGGSTNPFISYYLVLLMITATTLPAVYSWVLAGVTFACYSLLLFYYAPLNSESAATMGSAHAMHDEGSFFNLHIMGMWLTFVISALLITFFVVRMTQTIRRQELSIAENREKALHDEQVLAVATLAAGAAHELGTPLSTLTLLIEELRSDGSLSQSLQDDIELMARQVDACKTSLQNLTSKSQYNEQVKIQQVAVVSYVKEVIERWRLLRPDVSVSVAGLGENNDDLGGGVSNNSIIAVDETLSQAIMNLLNNAGDASPECVEISLHDSGSGIQLSIRDYGEGIPQALNGRLGEPFVSSKRKGLGLGLFLSNATVMRFGGRVTLYAHQEGGTLTELWLPLVAKPVGSAITRTTSGFRHHDDDVVK